MNVRSAGLNPAVLYEDMLSERPDWAHGTMRALDHANTYTFTKAVCEHLLRIRAAARRVSTVVVRPGIVGPVSLWHISYGILVMASSARYRYGILVMAY